MTNESCPDHKAHGEAIERHEQLLNEQGRRIGEEREARHSMELAIQKLTDLEEYAQKRIDQNDKALEKHEERIQALEDRPVNDAKRVKDAALAAVGGAIGTGAIGMMALLASKTVN